MLELRDNAEYPFIVRTPGSTLAHSSSTWQKPIYGSNKTVWHLNSVQKNYLWWIELLEIELFGPLAVCKQVTDV